jgi:hypothetical protein
LLIFIKGFQSPLRKLFKGDAMSPLVSEKSTKALLLSLKTLFNFPGLDHHLALVQTLLLVMLD